MVGKALKRLLPIAAVAFSCLPVAPASAEVRAFTYSVGPVTVGPYQVKQGFLAAPHPGAEVGDGFLRSIEVDVADADGTPVPINRLMLHHIVFLNIARRDSTCGRFTAWDSQSRLPAVERFYGAGEERNKAVLPPGYGYRVGRGDPWAVNYMFMNHRNRVDRAYVRYRITYDTDPSLTAVKPYWLDVRNCLADPVFDVPGGGRPGSVYRQSKTFTFPESGRIVAGAGHVHGGARDLSLRRADCGDAPAYRSRPVWGSPRHPFYKVRPILHEPGPISMSGFTSAQGIPVARGERLRLDADYDNRRVHTRVMGIMGVYLAPDESVTERCGPMPGEVAEAPQPAGRSDSPPFKVPIVGIRRGRARDISAPPGRRVRLRSGSTISVGDLFFRRPNVSVRKGSLLRWRFAGPTLHNVTVANGPRGFSSVNLSGGREYRTRLTRPGTYRLFCGLHPVAMTSTVKVRPR
jgi:plastocyanin